MPNKIPDTLELVLFASLPCLIILEITYVKPRVSLSGWATSRPRRSRANRPDDRKTDSPTHQPELFQCQFPLQRPPRLQGSLESLPSLRPLLQYHLRMLLLQRLRLVAPRRVFQLFVTLMICLPYFRSGDILQEGGGRKQGRGVKSGLGFSVDVHTERILRSRSPPLNSFGWLILHHQPHVRVQRSTRFDKSQGRFQLQIYYFTAYGTIYGRLTSLKRHQPSKSPSDAAKIFLSIPSCSSY